MGQLGGRPIVGVVVDPSDSMIVDAHVTAVDSRTNERKETITNEWGYYEFPLLPAGRYVLSAEACNRGYCSSRRAILLSTLQTARGEARCKTVEFFNRCFR
jgi:CRISPR/Cas system-associated exonuclease Cas4 (RecB family)